MIVPMKKISVVCLEKEKVGVLESLGQIGTVHIEQQNPQSPDLDAVIQEKAKAESALLLLEKTKQTPRSYDLPLKNLVKDIEDIQERQEIAQNRISELNRLYETFKNWGDFQGSDLDYLRKKGLFVELYAVPKEKEDLLKTLERKVILSQDKSLLRVAVIQETPELIPGLENIPWPEMGPSAAKQEISLVQKDLNALKGRLSSLSVHSQDLQSYIGTLDDQISWESAKATLKTDEKLAYFSGYVPVEMVEEVKKVASQEGFGVLSVDPSLDDAVPTKVKNGLIPRIIAPVFALLGTVPGYRERDISLPFLLFFTIFFGMIMGDAGYGALFLLIGLIISVQSLVKKKKVPDFALLLILLSSTTVVWGALTATWFGDLLGLGKGPVIDFLKSLSVQPFVDANYNTNAGFVKWVCFTLGVSQLVIAHLWNFIGVVKTGNILKSFAQLGGLVTTLALYPVVLGLVITGAESTVVKTLMSEWLKSIPLLFTYMYTSDVMMSLYIAGAGVLGVVLFGNQEGNFLKGLGDGLGNILNTALGAIGWFSDNISYIRLFAVGLAGFAIAQSFNSMGIGVYNSLGGGIVGFLVASLVLLFGHGLNIVMALLGVVVHGVRLNMLEFSSRLGMEWVGFEYKPLEKKTESKS